MNKYDDMRLAVVKEYMEDKIDRITFNARIAMINEQEEREANAYIRKTTKEAIWDRTGKQIQEQKNYT